MTVYQISYDLQSPGQDYEELLEAIKPYPGWAHILESSWFVSTSNHTAAEIRDGLMKHIDSNDKLLVVKADPSGWATTFSNDGTEWMHKSI